MITAPRPIQAADKLVPFDAEIEYSLLSCLVLQPVLMDELETFPPEAFYVTKHRIVFEGMRALWRDNTQPDLFTLAAYFQSEKRLEELGGRKYFAALFESRTWSIGWSDYVKILLDKYQARRLISASNKIGELAFTEAMPIEMRVDQSQQLIYEISETAESTKHASHVSDVLIRTLERIDSGRPQGIRGSSGKFKTLYDLTGGIFPSHLHVAAAETRTGKTHFGIAQALDYASLFPVLFISCEMTEEEITDRALARLSGVDSHRITNGILRDDEQAKVYGPGLQKLSDMNLHIWSVSNPSGHEIRSEIRRIARVTGNQVQLVVLDYIQLLHRGRTNPVEDLDMIARDCKEIAYEFQLCFLSLAQISRDFKNRSNKRPMVQDIRGSGAIENHSNRIYLLYRDELHNPDTSDRGVMEINTAKNRGGKEGMVKMLFDPARSWFGPYSSNAYQD